MVKLLFSLLSVILFVSSQGQVNHRLYIGTYTNNNSKGIYVVAPGKEEAVLIAETNNPSYLAILHKEKNLFAVNENNDGNGTGGSVSSFKIDKATGKLNFINRVSSAGSDPCYISIHPNRKWLAVGNYSSGTVSIFPVIGDSVGNLVDLAIHEGKSTNKNRQASPHVHAAVFSPDGNYLYTPDLGTDKVFIYSFNKKTGNLTPASMPYAPVAEGAGPRHFVFHPNKKQAYLIEELTGKVVVFDFDKSTGALKEKQVLSTVVAGFMGYAGSADIHISPDGKFLYCSNRGDANDIAIFSIEKETGLLKLITHQSVMGKTPRNFIIDPSGKYLYVANQDSNEVVIFNRNKKTGILADSGKRISVPNPVCLQWSNQFIQLLFKEKM